MDKKTCPRCGEEISPETKKCPCCNELIDSTVCCQEFADDAAVASTTCGTSGAAISGIRYSKGLVGFMVFLSVFGMLLSFIEFVPMSNYSELREFYEILLIIGDIMDGTGTCVLMCMYGIKIASEGIKGVSKVLVMATGIIYILSVIIGCYDSESFMLLIMLLAYLVCWIIAGIQSVKVERLRKIGIWMIVAVVLEFIVAVIIDSYNYGGKGFFKAVALVYIWGYIKMYRYLKEYLCSQDINSNNS